MGWDTQAFPTLPTSVVRFGKPLRAGTTAQNAAYTGAEGELTYDLTLAQVRWHDGSTVGGTVITGGSGGVFPTTHKGVLVTRSSDLSVSTSSDTSASWQTEVYDVGGFWASSPTPWKFIIPSGVSYVQLFGGVDWAADATGWRHIWFEKGGSHDIPGMSKDSDATADASANTRQAIMSGVVAVSAADEFEMIIRQTSGGNLAAKANGATYFGLRWLG